MAARINNGSLVSEERNSAAAPVNVVAIVFGKPISRLCRLRQTVGADTVRVTNPQGERSFRPDYANANQDEVAVASRPSESVSCSSVTNGNFTFSSRVLSVTFDQS